MITFFVTFLILLIVSAFFCNGFFNLTRGFKYQYPDGKISIEGDVLKWWQIFWEAKNNTEKVYYSNDNLELKQIELSQMDKTLSARVSVGISSFKIDGVELNEAEQLKIEKLLGLKLCKWATVSNNCVHYSAYSEYPKYRFPEWVRKPISACVKCYASVYGSAIWWSFVYLQKDAFLWTSNKNVAVIVFWFIFIVGNSWLNAYFSTKIK